MKVLILKPSSLGDVVQALPVARHLKRQMPDAEIHWWLNRELMPLLEWDPDISRLIPFDRHLWAKTFGWTMLVESIAELRATRFDWVLDLQALARSGVIGWLAGGRFLAGLEDWREGAPLFYDLAVPRPSEETHAVDWYLSLAQRMGISTDEPISWFPTTAKGTDLLNARWPEAVQSPWIALQPGARWDTKRWPIASYSALARQILLARPDLRIVIFGGKDDQALGKTIEDECGERVLDLTGRISLTLLVEWMRHIRLLITNDTGPMHIAAGMGKPIVALFGPTNPSRTGPYGQPDSVLQTRLDCVPCLSQKCHNPSHLACLNGLKVDDVLAKVLSQI
jgi:lipopolysaccharide heptosyltransferase I